MSSDLNKVYDAYQELSEKDRELFHGYINGIKHNEVVTIVESSIVDAIVSMTEEWDESVEDGDYSLNYGQRVQDYDDLDEYIRDNILFVIDASLSYSATITAFDVIRYLPGDNADIIGTVDSIIAAASEYPSVNGIAIALVRDYYESNPHYFKNLAQEKMNKEDDKDE